MRTSEDARLSGLYGSECCGEELIFTKGDTFWRCPQCHHLCDWEPLKIVESSRDLEDLKQLRSQPAMA